jgi:hypothetical protein
MSIEEATVSNMWEIAAIVELLDQKGFCTKQDLHTIIDELRRKNPHARIPETAFPEPYLLTETENKIIDKIINLSLQHKRLDREGGRYAMKKSRREQRGIIGSPSAGSGLLDLLVHGKSC